MKEESNLNDAIKKSIDTKNKFMNDLGVNDFSNYAFENNKSTALQRSIELQNQPFKSMTREFNSLDKLNESLGLNKIFLNPLFSQQSVFSSVADSLNSLNALKESIGINSCFSKITEIFDTQQKIISGLFNSLNSINDIFKNFEFKSVSKLSGYDSSLLDKFYWVIPFEYEYEKVRTLEKYETSKEFEKYILKYFNNNRVKRMFAKIKKGCKEKDKKELLKQIENSYFNGDYAICITSLVTLLDGLTLKLIEPNSDSQHLSYKAINDMLEYMNDRPITEFSYELYLKVDIQNNFYAKLYHNEVHFKTTTRKDLSRHINSHGVKYLNSKIDVLRLLNAIYFCQQIISETNLQEEFTKDKKTKKFIKMSTNLQSTK